MTIPDTDVVATPGVLLEPLQPNVTMDRQTTSAAVMPLCVIDLMCSLPDNMFSTGWLVAGLVGNQ
jgi:hypothetical protein